MQWHPRSEGQVDVIYGLDHGLLLSQFRWVYSLLIKLFGRAQIIGVQTLEVPQSSIFRPFILTIRINDITSNFYVQSVARLDFFFEKFNMPQSEFSQKSSFLRYGTKFKTRAFKWFLVSERIAEIWESWTLFFRQLHTVCFCHLLMSNEPPNKLLYLQMQWCVLEI